MACGCAKNKPKVAARTVTPSSSPTPFSPEGQTNESVLEHTSFRRIRYLVCPRAVVGQEDPVGCESYNVLAEAQKRIRDLGSAYAIKATRKPF